MQIYHNVLSQELIQDCWKEVEYLSNQKVWSSSSTTWGEGTMQGVTGSTLITKVSTTTESKIKIIRQMSNRLPFLVSASNIIS